MDTASLHSEFPIQHEFTSKIIDENLEIGLKLENIIQSANNATQGLNTTFFIGIVLSLVVQFFLVVSTLGLNNSSTGILSVLYVSGSTINVAMFLLRFYRLMNCGDKLWRKVKQSRRTLENAIMLNDSIGIKEKDRQKSYVLQKRLDVYQYLPPISPYSAFGLCGKTFSATLATVISYVVILIKLRGADDKHAVITSRAINGTISRL